MKTLMTTVFILLFATTAMARAIRVWTYEELLKECDVAAIGRVIKIEDTAATLDGHGAPEQYQGKRATAIVGLCLKGNPSDSLNFNFFTYSSQTIPPNGAMFPDLSKADNKHYLLFLNKASNGSLMPVSGHYDGSASIRPVESNGLIRIEKDQEITCLTHTDALTDRPAASWTPPPERFCSKEWKNDRPSWAKTRSERGGTVVWFYVEMSQKEALPVLLRTLDHGQTWLQTKAVMELSRLTIPFPTAFKDKVVKFYRSINLNKFARNRAKLSSPAEDRLVLKMELVMLIYKIDRTKGNALLEQLSTKAPQKYIRVFAKKTLSKLEQSK